jgi:hypothetical protein
MGGLNDAGVWGLVWALFAAVAGFGLAAAARLLLDRPRDDDEELYGRGYNALAPLVDR